MQHTATTGDADEQPAWSTTNAGGLPPKLFELQGKLYLKAKAEPGFRFYSLFGLMLRRDVLMAALDRVVRNNGCPGVDGVTIAMIVDRPGGVAGSPASDCSNESQPMNHTGKPDAGNLPVRFDEGGGVGQWHCVKDNT